MLKTLSTLIVFVSLTTLCFGQKTLWSTPQKITNKTYYTQIIGQNPLGLFYYQTSKNDRFRNVLITSLNHQMKTQARKGFITSPKERLEKLSVSNSHLGLFYTTTDKKTKTVNLYYKTLNEDLESVIADKQIFMLTNVDLRYDYYKVVEARNREEYLVFIGTHKDSLKTHQKVLHLDKFGNEKGRGDLELPTQDEFTLKMPQFLNGNFYALFEQVERSGVFKKEINHSLIELKLDSFKTKLIKLSNDEYRLKVGSFKFDHSSKSLNYNCLYYTNDSLKPKGFYSFNLNTESGHIKTRRLLFKGAFIHELFANNGGKPDLKTLHLVTALKRSDGGDIFICERREVDEQNMDDISMYGVQSSYSRFYYYYYDISILSLNPDGSIDWHKMINKEQISLNDNGYYSSFGCHIKENKIWFVFNDLTRKTSNILMYQVNPNGKTDGDILIRGKEINGYAIPRESIQLSQSELLVPVVKLREGFTFMKLIF